MFALEREPLQPLVRAVGYNHRGFMSCPVVDPNAVGSIKLAIAFAWSAEHRFPIAVLVVIVDAIGAVAIGQIEAAVREEGKIGGHKGVATPPFGRLGVLARWVDAGIHGRSLFPN